MVALYNTVIGYFLKEEELNGREGLPQMFIVPLFVYLVTEVVYKANFGTVPYSANYKPMYFDRRWGEVKGHYF